MNDASYVFRKIKGKNVRILLDTGTNHNIMDFDYAKSLGLFISQNSTRFRLYTANSGQMSVIGSVSFTVKFNSCSFPTRAYVVADLADKILLGRSFFE